MRAKSAGFTLLEVIVALLMVGILLAAAAPYFSGMMGGSQLREAAGDLLSGLRKARAEAIASNKECRFELNPGQNSYTLLLSTQSAGSSSGDFTVISGSEVDFSTPVVLRSKNDCSSNVTLDLTFSPNGTMSSITGATTDSTADDYPYAICVMDGSSSTPVKKYRVQATSLTTASWQIK